jgi:hypothetical protein
MDHIKILKRAWAITWDYRLLWVFGILIALGSARARGNGGGGGGGGGGSSATGLLTPVSTFGSTIASRGSGSWELAFVLGIAFLIIALIVATQVLRYLSEVAVIRMVDLYETSGEKVSLRQGFAWGWSRSTLRIFLIDLLLALAGMVAFLLMLIVAAAPLLVWLTKSSVLQAIGTSISVILGVLMILILIAYVIVASLLVQFFRRACVLEDLGVIESMQRGWQVIRMRLGDVVIMALLVFAILLGLTLLMIPLFLLLGLVGILLGGIPALLVGGIASLFVHGDTPWIIAALVGMPVFVLVVAAPLLFAGGLIEVYKSSIWTLTYREVLALASSLPARPAHSQTEPNHASSEPANPSDEGTQ